jgi:pyruvate dehydrogenase (quinone)
VLRNRRRHAEPHRPRYRSQRDRLGAGAARGGGAFAAGAEALLTDRLTACARTCGPNTLHFINGLYEANRNGAPVIQIAMQVVRQDIGFESIQEIDFNDVFKGCSVYCEMIAR